LASRVAAPYAVNLIVHQSNPRLADDLPEAVVERVHAYEGIVLPTQAIVARLAQEYAEAGRRIAPQR
jgi:hypothetical protein